MNTGMRGKVTAMMSVESRSWPRTVSSTATGTMTARTSCRQIPGVVAVEGIDAAGDQGRGLAGTVGTGAGRSEREHVRDRRLAQLLLGPRGGAHRGHLRQPRHEGPQANTAATTTTVSRTSDQSAPSEVTDTMTLDSSLAWEMTSTAVTTPSTTAIPMKPRVLRA